MGWTGHDDWQYAIDIKLDEDVEDPPEFIEEDGNDFLADLFMLVCEKGSSSFVEIDDK